MNFLSKTFDRALKCFSLLLISAILLFVPLKILSYGWSPNYAMLISSALTKNSDMPVNHSDIVESIKELTTLHKRAAENNLINIVTAAFLLFNIVGLCHSKNHIGWFAALTLFMITNDNFIKRLLNSSPQLLLCMLLIELIAIFEDSIKEKPKTSLFLFSLFILMLRYVIPPEIYALDVINTVHWNPWFTSPSEFYSLMVDNCWLFFAPFVIWLTAYKEKNNFTQHFNDPILAIALLLQIAINFGFLDLSLFRDTFVIVWLTNKFSQIIELTECFKELRVKHCLGLYVLIAFVFTATHDFQGKFSKTAIENFPIDFSIKELAGWAPGKGGIVYNDNANFAFTQYYFNPDSNYSFFYLNSFNLFKEEKENILKIKAMLARKKTPTPDYYELWVNQMKQEDRLLTSAKINGLENIEWLQCRRNTWIGRLKQISNKQVSITE